ncbi:MAG: hypothetical protein LBI57_02220 [Helicobacteraceae bacterium]|nr:hypothetical protein [Helicobacteraceae bacterium]
MISRAALFILLCSLGFCASPTADRNVNAKAAQEPNPKTDAPIYPAPLKNMIGQMIVVGFEGINAADDRVKRVAAQIKNGSVGGVIIYARNVGDPVTFERLTRSLHYSISDNPPLWIMIDQEGGKVQRLNSQKGFSDYPSAKKIGKGTLNAAFSVYRDLACELRGYGINFNLAPTVDLDRGEGVIAADERAFSADARKTTGFATQFVNAHDSCGVLTAIKHFPGHGSASGDPHIESADATAAYAAEELTPFKALIDAKKARAVMVSHIIDRDVDNAPATLSKTHIDRLRALGFDGAVIGDDLQMGAIALNYDLNETIVKAINAGDNILLFSNMFAYDPEIPEKAQIIVKKAIASGEIDPQKIIDSYNRVIALKQRRQ